MLKEFKEESKKALSKIDNDLLLINDKFDNHLTTITRDIVKKNKFLLICLLTIVLFVLIPEEGKLSAFRVIVRFFGLQF